MNGKTFLDAVQNPNALQEMINITFLFRSSMLLIIYWTRTVYGTWIQQLLYHPIRLLIGTPCAISIHKQQPTNLDQTYICRSFHWDRWTFKGRNCVSALHFFKELTLRTDEWTKQLLWLTNWVIFGSLEQGMEFHRLWWTLVVFKCCYLFHLFEFFRLLVQYLLFLFWKFTFLFPFFDDFEWEVKVHQQLLCKVTLP